MTTFRVGHATHPRWSMALEMALAQIGAAEPPPTERPSSLGVVYVTEAFGPHLAEVLAALRGRCGVRHWTAACAPAICATGVEYGEEPALALMVAALPDGSFEPFPIPARRAGDSARASVAQPAAALIHADVNLPDVGERIPELAGRTRSGALFGALASAVGRPTGPAGAMVGLDAVGFSEEVGLVTGVTQGCSAIGAEHRITACAGQMIESLDGRPALDVLLADLDVRLPAASARDGEAIRRALPAQRLREGLFVGLTRDEPARKPGFGDYLVRSVVGIDPSRRLVAIGELPQEGDRLVFCTRDREAAQRDLVRVVAELRDEIEQAGNRVAGALYHSCVARGSHLFGSQGAELATIRHHLGEVPLVGMYGHGEIARDRIYGHTGVLTLFFA
jgi:small ligand-binding sensory domain FIST